MNNIALITTFFDYPIYALPCFYNNALKYFKKDDIHIIRNNEPNSKLTNYYEKLYTYKIIKNLEYYKQRLLGNYEFLLFGDAKDTNFYRDPSNIVEDFKKYNCNILFCAENGFWPPINEKDLYEKKEKLSDTFYLNSGLYIGYTEKIIQHMEIIVNENRTVYDDQGHWAIEYLLSDDIKVDQEKKIFFSTFEAKHELIIGDKITIPFNPYMIHDNGPFNDKTLKFADKL